MRNIITYLILVMLGVGFSVWGWGLITDARLSLHWPTVTGRVIHSRVKNYTSISEGKSTQMYSADIGYRYTVNNKTYTSRSVSLGDHASGSSGGMRKLTMLYPVGKIITVYYDPRKPGSSLLEPGPAFITYLPFAFGVLSVIAGLAAFIRRNHTPMPPPGSRYSELKHRDRRGKTTDQSNVTFEMTVESLAKITGRGTMFVGHIKTGNLSNGDRIEIISTAQPRTVDVMGIVRMPSQNMVQSGEAGDEVGIMVADFDLNEPHPGIQRVEGQFVPVNLTLRATGR